MYNFDDEYNLTKRQKVGVNAVPDTVFIAEESNDCRDI